jgi:flagellar biosynthesis/type III secretory pathway M-ring protein FliF/YscJ
MFMCFPLCHQQTTTHNTTKYEYDKIKQYIEIQAPKVERQTRAPWISSKTWQMIDSRASKAKRGSFHPGERQRLSRQIKRAPQRDQKERTAIAGNEIEQNLQSGKLKPLGTSSNAGTNTLATVCHAQPDWI